MFPRCLVLSLRCTANTGLRKIGWGGEGSERKVKKEGKEGKSGMKEREKKGSEMVTINGIEKC